MQHYPLWTRNFTITTVGSLISMMGNAVTKFALGRVVFDNTGSESLYAIFLAVATVARIIVPLFAGPYLDRVSRRDTIIRVDLFYTFMFVALSLLTTANIFNYPLFLLIAVLLGCADSLYAVTYDSFYPELISPGNFSKAYSIGSLLHPLANTVMIPVANVVYETVGVAPLFYFNAAAFFLTQWVERKIIVKEKHLQPGNQPSQRPSYVKELLNGVHYLKEEKGLMAITGFFVITMLVLAMPETLMLPFFTTHPVYTVQMYSFLTSAHTLGRITGALFHYRVPIPPKRKFAIALGVYIAISLLQGPLLYLPYPLMIISMYFYGVLGVTSFNIRTSGTQSYVPSHLRGRFNSLFTVLTTCGTLVGQLMAGALGERFSIPLILLIFQGLYLISALLIMLPMKKHVKKVYNQAL
ncbi:MAG: MFS transporter [Clostridia bacterium]|nr:MFS transporter [Clostridia bacterium]